MDVNLDFWIRFSGVVAAALNVWGFLVLSETRIKGLFAASSLVWAIQYFLLGSASGAAIMLLAAVRQVMSMQAGSMSLNEKWAWTGFFSVAAVVLTLLTVQVWAYALVGLLATLIGTWSFFLGSNESIRKWTVLTNSLWAIHAWVFESWELLVCMLVLNVVNVFSIVRLSRGPVPAVLR